MNKQNTFELTCDYVFVDTDNTKRGHKNWYRVVPISMEDWIKVGNHPVLTTGRRIYAECDYTMFSHEGAGKIYNGPWNITYKVDKKDRATLISIKENK